MKPAFPVFRAGQGIDISLAGQAIVFSSTEQPAIVARITGTAGTNTAGKTLYSWVEQQVDKTGGAYADMPGGRSGNLAVELNDNQTEIDTIVRLNPRGAGTDKQNQTFLEFSLGGGGTTIQIVRAIAQWTQGSANAPVYVSQIGWLFQAYLLDSVTGQPTYDQNGIVKVFIRTTYPEGQVQPVNGVYTSTVLKDQGDYFGILTGQTQLEPVLNMELPIYLVPNSYTERLIPTYFACTDNGLQITYERIRIPNGVSNGTYIP